MEPKSPLHIDFTSPLYWSLETLKGVTYVHCSKLQPMLVQVIRTQGSINGPNTFAELFNRATAQGATALLYWPTVDPHWIRTD